jgi:hypothetical protein
MLREYKCVICGNVKTTYRSPANLRITPVPKTCSQSCNGKLRTSRKKGKTPNIKKHCECCGTYFETYRSPALVRKYGTPKYCSLKCTGTAQTGENNPSYTKGYVIFNTGYKGILVPDHPNSDSRGYVLEHRYVMEQKLGRHLQGAECVHHINGNRLDNRPENLQLFKNNSEHMKHHASCR